MAICTSFSGSSYDCGSNGTVTVTSSENSSPEGPSTKVAPPSGRSSSTKNGSPSEIVKSVGSLTAPAGTSTDTPRRSRSLPSGATAPPVSSITRAYTACSPPNSPASSSSVIVMTRFGVFATFSFAFALQPPGPAPSLRNRTT
jgi:hypothetical protein